jgi:glycosyltransferase involved in cell wall biosynthesis
MKPASMAFRILVISDYRDVNSSRPEAEIFIQLARLGHTVHIITFPQALYYNDRFRSFGIQVFENHPTKKAHLPYIRFLRQFVREGRYDIVHAFNSYGLTNAIWAMVGLSAKLIAYRGYAGQTYWYDPMMYTKYFHPRVDHIICLSDDIRSILAKHMPWGKDKLTTIHKGHDPLWYEHVPRVDRASFGFSDSDILVVCVANVRPFKGIPYLIRSTYFLDPTLPVHLILLGNGYDVGTVKTLIEQSPNRDRIHCLGFRKDSLSIVAACDASVLSSTHGEALTKSIIESMCLGVPPIITEIPGNNGLVIDGVSGWVVPPKDPESLAHTILLMASDRGERKRRGANATEHIRRYFNTTRTVAEFLQLYEKLLAKQS